MDNSTVEIANYSNNPTVSTQDIVYTNFKTKGSTKSCTSGSGYVSEADTEMSMMEDCLNHNPLFIDNPSQQSLENYTIDKGAMSDLLGPSDSELFQVKKDLVTNLHIIEDAETAATQVLNRLQSLWLNIDDKASLPSLTSPTPGDHKLLQVIRLTTFVVKEMETEWNSFVARPLDANKMRGLEQTNRLLKEQLESSRVIQNCLESELKYLEKEKSLLNDEVKELSLQIASQQQQQQQCSKTSGYLNLHNNENSQNNNNSTTVSPHDGRSSQTNKTTTMPIVVVDSYRYQQQHQQQPQKISSIIVKRPSSGIRQVGIISNTNIRKREHDFDSIMNFVRARGTAMDSLNSQMEKYDEDFQTLQEEILQVASEKVELHQAYEALLDEHKKLSKERTSYESILNMILKERKGTEESIHTILETLINKLNAMGTDDHGNSSRFTVLEEALHAVQSQNSSYREEITELKTKLNTVEQNHLTAKSELDAHCAKARVETEELKTALQVKTEEVITCQQSCQDRYCKLQELYDAIAIAKTEVDKALAEKEVELAKQQALMEAAQKGSFRQQKKIQELQRANHKLLRETQDQKRNMEQLNVVVSQLRSNLKEQKVQWGERMKSAGDEASQIKDHCRWLQAQIDHLNRQLAEAHERVKCYEKDKTTLAQQIMSAEEERKVVDRKLEELRAALQGDTVLREALMERNEALQIEINRLRRAKLMNLGGHKDGDYSEPPSEFSEMSSLASVPPTTYALPDNNKNYHHNHPHNNRKDPPQKKNRYAAGLASNYHHGKDSARNAISAHNSSAIPSSQGASPLSTD